MLGTANALEYGRLEFCRYLLVPGNPVVESDVLDLDQALKIVEIGGAEAVQHLVGEMAEDEVHFLDAPVPGTELEPPQANFVIGGSDFGHFDAFPVWGGI
jgi:hypothetical protein